jgi:hypothetical protein
MTKALKNSELRVSLHYQVRIFFGQPRILPTVKGEEYSTALAATHEAAALRMTALKVLLSVFLGAACLVVYLEFLRETAAPEKVKRAARERRHGRLRIPGS